MSIASIFREGDLRDVERLSAGLSREEVLDCYCVMEEELSQSDADLFNRAYRKGRAMAKAKAVDALFAQMITGKDGVKGALSYLTRLANEWESDEEMSGSGGRVLKIELGD